MFVWYFTSVVGVFWCCKCYSSPSARRRAESSLHYEQHDSKASSKNVVIVRWEEWIKNARKRNKKRVAVAVRCAIVDYDLTVLYNEFIRQWKIGKILT